MLSWNKLQFKVCQVALASVAYLDKHSTLDPAGGNFLKFFKPLTKNSKGIANV